MKLGPTSASFEQPALTETLAKPNDALEQNMEQHNPEQSNVERELPSEPLEANETNREIGISRNDMDAKEAEKKADFERMHKELTEAKTLKELSDIVLKECSKIDSKQYPIVNIEGQDYYKVQDADANGQQVDKYLAKGDHGEIDFSPVARATVDMLNPGGLRQPLFLKLDKAYAEQLNLKRSDITKRRADEHLTWHESEDMQTMYLVPQEFHRMSHNGGNMVAETLKKHGIDTEAYYRKENA